MDIDWKDEDDPLDIGLDEEEDFRYGPEELSRIVRVFWRAVERVDLEGLSYEEAKQEFADRYKKVAEMLDEKYGLDLRFESREGALRYAERYIEGDSKPLDPP